MSMKRLDTLKMSKKLTLETLRTSMKFRKLNIIKKSYLAMVSLIMS